MPDTPLLKLYRKFIRYPAGHWLFSRAVCFKAPYFGSIRPTIHRLENGLCEASIPHRRAVQNHIGTVHAIALCNLAELCAGVMIDASLPADMRWIPKGMTVSYLKKASGTMRAVATPNRPIVSTNQPYDLPINVDAFDAAGQKAFNAIVTMWISPKPSPVKEAR